MNSNIYINRIYYYDLIKRFLDKKISIDEFDNEFLQYRLKDLEKNKKLGYYEYYDQMINNLKGNKKKFQKLYSDHLYENAWSTNIVKILKKYEKGARHLYIKGEMFFMGIWYILDEYMREYYPSYKEEFEPNINIDEETLKEKINAIFNILERNKDLWDYEILEEDMNSQNQIQKENKNESAIGKIIGKIKGMFDGAD